MRRRNYSPELRHLYEVGAQMDLRPEELKDLNEQTARVWVLMRDRRWHSARAIRRAAGNGHEATEGLRRMRTLRRLYQIDKRRQADGRGFEYCIARRWTTPHQLNIFSGDLNAQ